MRQITNKFICLVFSLLILALSPANAHDKAGGEKSSLAKEPFAYSYHGVLVDADMREIELSPRYLEAAMHHYIQEVLAFSSTKLVQEYRQFDKEFLWSPSIDEFDRIKIRAQLLEATLEYALADKERLARNTVFADKLKSWKGKSAALRLNLPKAYKIDASGKKLAAQINGVPQAVRNALYAYYRQQRLTIVGWIIKAEFIIWDIEWLFPDSTPYMEDCRAAGVPVPPKWSDHRWVAQGELINEFISASSRAFAYTYTSAAPEGTCIALPRVNASGTKVGVFGIICLGLETENACFWDKYDTPISEFNDEIRISEFISGVDFTGAAGNCSSCHAGENPFVIHPNANIAGSNNISVNWHTPLFNPTWPTNPGPVSLNADTSYSTVQWYNPFSWFNERKDGASCVGCHKLPNAGHSTLKNEGYCSLVLRLAAERTMPPTGGSRAGWGSSNSSDYQVHIEQLWDLCN